MNFTLVVKKPYQEDLPLTFGCVPKANLDAAYRDGRAASFLVVEQLLARHRNLRRVKEPDYPDDCVQMPDGRILLVRVVTQGGTFLNPHKQNGYGRKVNLLEHQRERLKFFGYLLVDVTEMPRITYSYVSKTRVPEGCFSPTCEDAQFLISLCGTSSP